ncbi:DEAD/DEAH box helicase [Paenibacillus koleovorans]|uniref:DEAD/DEAH box helicase n=1 Tax=Paenibacillus koleovorans TaxID=121608 RepID=UPI000FDBDEFE|nr:DEAD/DEAH box helicase [Paenibacillus koleovorans]
MTTTAFSKLGLRHELTEALRRNGLVQPTPVQERTLPVALAGNDVIVQAQTGTGKTLAFVLPLLERVNPELPHVQGLIVTPTRELAIQITDEVKKLSGAVGVTVLAAYGGQDVTAQLLKLKEAPHLIVATPGRLLDHLRRESIRLDRLSMLVLDEADQMLHIGYLPEVEAIIEQTPVVRQTMLFSATMPDHVRQLAADYMRNPQDIRVLGKRITVEGIRQVVVETTDRAKQSTLVSMIEKCRPYLAVVFCRTKIRAKKLAEALLGYGLNVDELHGDLTQAKREQVMKRFREAELQILVATDVAARGLDVEGVTHVFNYDIPHDAESYIHRIGRTARAGQKGTAITLAAPRDAMYLTQIEKELGFALERERGTGAGNGENREAGGAGGTGRNAGRGGYPGERRQPRQTSGDARRLGVAKTEQGRPPIAREGNGGKREGSQGPGNRSRDRGLSATGYSGAGGNKDGSGRNRRSDAGYTGAADSRARVGRDRRAEVGRTDEGAKRGTSGGTGGSRHQPSSSSKPSRGARQGRTPRRGR